MRAQDASRLLLTLFFKAVLGIQRIFHLGSLQDAGLALLTGGRRVLSRTAVGRWLRRVSMDSVELLMRRSQPPLPRQPEHLISIDEHAVPRFSRKFRIPKGFHTIRNKFMPVELLVFSFHCGLRCVLGLLARAGDGKLGSLAQTLLEQLRSRLRGARVRVVLDAGAARHTDSLLTLADRPNQTLLVRAPRRPSYRRAWQSLPASSWQRLEEPGPYTAAPAKVLHLAQTTTRLTDTRQGSKRSRPVRTIVIRENTGSGKHRWHALWIFGDEQTPAYTLVQQYRQRQHQEQRYRVMLHDAMVDAAPSGYDKHSPDPNKPRFCPAALSLYAWAVGMATDALERLSRRLGAPNWVHAHPRTLRREWLALPGQLYLLGRDRLLVVIRVRHLRPLWEALVRRLNRDPVRIPWLENRKVLLSLDGPNGHLDRQGVAIP